jgi:alpha,alpha-trehalase
LLFVLPLLVALLGGTRSLAAPVHPATPDQIFGQLFVDVQEAHVFPDQKTFPDAVPLGAPATILRDYATAKGVAGFDLRRFVLEHFAVPQERAVSVPRAPDIEAHINELWTLLRRAPDRRVPGSSLLPLPDPYIVPGGRFREIYYWDSYFTMLGLRESGREDLIESMVDNFAYELATFGLIPNGNRTYYLSRSQPPFFALMVEFLAAKKGDSVYAHYRDALAAEYAYWMDRTFPTQHVVKLSDGSVLNRYWDRRDSPRQEAFVNDMAAAREATRAQPGQVYRDLRSAAESGWDFSSRWFADGRSLSTIETTNILPVDLNCLLWQLETTLGRAYRVSGDAAKAAELARAAERRQQSILATFWSEKDGFFCDYDLRARHPRSNLTLAGVAPLFLQLATPAQAAAVAKVIATRFLRPGGVVTTLRSTGQQWDAPNGWAPLQWMTVHGLANYGHDALAAEIAQRWTALNRAVYQRTGRMMEKYNVEDVSLAAGGGEYPSQDGFGWTNGVYLKLAHGLRAGEE